MDFADSSTIAELLTTTHTWAVVGCSPDPNRDSHRIAALLKTRGFQIIPINPTAAEILGERAYPSLADVPEPIDVVDIFRRADQAGAHVDEAIAIGAKAVWMQLGVIDTAAAQRAADAGLAVVMDRCPAIELPRLVPEPSHMPAGLWSGATMNEADASVLALEAQHETRTRPPSTRASGS